MGSDVIEGSRRVEVALMTSSAEEIALSRRIEVMRLQICTFAAKSYFCESHFWTPTGGHTIGRKYPEIPPYFCYSFSRIVTHFLDSYLAPIWPPLGTGRHNPGKVLWARQSHRPTRPPPENLWHTPLRTSPGSPENRPVTRRKKLNQSAPNIPPAARTAYGKPARHPAKFRTANRTMNTEIPDIENQLTVPGYREPWRHRHQSPPAVMGPTPSNCPLLHPSKRQVSEEILWTPEPATLVVTVSRTPPRLVRSTCSTTITHEILRQRRHPPLLIQDPPRITVNTLTKGTGNSPFFSTTHLPTIPPVEKTEPVCPQHPDSIQYGTNRTSTEYVITMAAIATQSITERASARKRMTKHGVKMLRTGHAPCPTARTSVKKLRSCPRSRCTSP